MISDEEVKPEVGLGSQKWGREERRVDGKEEENPIISVARASLTGSLVAVAGRTHIAVEP